MMICARPAISFSSGLSSKGAERQHLEAMMGNKTTAKEIPAGDRVAVICTVAREHEHRGILYPVGSEIKLRAGQARALGFKVLREAGADD